MDEAATSEGQPRRRRLSRAALLGLIAVFVGPLLFAVVMYSQDQSWRPSGQVNHGTLISPARPLEPIVFEAADGARLNRELFRGKWTLVYLGTRACGLQCETALFKTRQARAALGRDSDRVQRLYLVRQGPVARWPENLSTDHPELVLAVVDPGSRAAANAGFGEHVEGQVFVVDPLGNVMMRYGADATTKGILKDLKRLLKVSQIG